MGWVAYSPVYHDVFADSRGYFIECNESGTVTGMKRFNLVSTYTPAGDQPKAIESLVHGIEEGARHQTLLGVTGSGKTFTVANVIQKVQKPTLVIAHNKTLAAQLAAEYREFFPENEVHYFVSYYDYYQPEAYVPTSDTYIEKEASLLHIRAMYEPGL